MVQEMVDMLKKLLCINHVLKRLYLESFKITCKIALNRLPQMKQEWVELAYLSYFVVPMTSVKSLLEFVRIICKNCIK